MAWFTPIIDGMTKIQSEIENDTFDFLENDTEMPELHIEYKGIEISIPLDVAEINNTIQDEIREFIDMMNDYADEL